MVIKRVKPMSFAKMGAVIYGLFGLIAGGIISLFGVLGGLASMSGRDSGLGPMFGMLFGVGAIIVLPICYAIFGFIGGLIGGLIFNFAAGMIGGLELEVQQ